MTERNRRPTMILAAAAPLIVAVVSGAALGQSRPEASPRAFQALGDRAIPSDRIEFVSPNEEFPPRPKDYRESRPVKVDGVATLSEERLQAAQRAAIDNAQVRTALGTRFVNLETGPAEEDKTGRGLDAAIVRFYGYETRNTVSVVVSAESQVIAVRVQSGLHPPEVPAEIRAANEIALRESSNKERLSNLVLTGILTDPTAVQQPKDHRVIYLTYNTPSNELVHVAWVDLTTQKIVKEGPPPTQRRR